MTAPLQTGHVRLTGTLGAYAEPDQDVRLVVARGQHQHRHRSRALDPPAHLVAVEPGQHHVQDHQVRGALRALRDGTRPVPGLHDVVPGTAQPVGDRLVDKRFVLDDQDLQDAPLSGMTRA